MADRKLGEALQHARCEMKQFSTKRKRARRFHHGIVMKMDQMKRKVEQHAAESNELVGGDNGQLDEMMKLNDAKLSANTWNCSGGGQIFANTLTGKTITLDVGANEKVDCLKAKIRNKTGIPAYDQRLIFSGKELEGERLRDFGVGKGSTIHLMLRLRGGGDGGNDRIKKMVSAYRKQVEPVRKFFRR